MSKYYPITITEMENFLIPKGFQKINLPNTDEVVFGKRVDTTIPLSVRVYSGINPTGESRKNGEDAIRVNIFTKKQDGTLTKVVSAKRVHRVEGWKNNLTTRIEEVLEKAPSKHCPLCGEIMALREGKSKASKTPYKFHGCTRFPLCRATLPA